MFGYIKSMVSDMFVAGIEDGYKRVFGSEPNTIENHNQAEAFLARIQREKEAIEVKPLPATKQSKTVKVLPRR